MLKDDVLDIFRQSGALLEGHFILTSGAHSPNYFQCAKVLQYPNYAQLLCGEIALHFKDHRIHVVAAPAVGGILVAHEVARTLNARCIFAERENGEMAFRRGFDIKRDENVLVVEDVVTTGGSLKEVIKLCRSANGNVVGVGFLVDRSGGSIDFGVPYYSLVQVDVVKHEPEKCPLCKEGKISAVKPGSRLIRSS
ncbi:MAG: orotate phosphoribosyltransferase [Bacteroidetes bacterium]|nr:orotate phosphoribosyltransferase [Bacteroidota bacterium]